MRRRPSPVLPQALSAHVEGQSGRLGWHRTLAASGKALIALATRGEAALISSITILPGLACAGKL
jgi:hypothetical protein